MDLTKRAQTALRETYQPDGFNVGMNLAKLRGRVLPTTFISTSCPLAGGYQLYDIGREARVIPEDLATTFEKLRSRF